MSWNQTFRSSAVKLCSLNVHNECVPSYPSPNLCRGSRKKGGIFSAARAPAFGGSWECLRGKVPPGIVWQMVWSEASGLRGWSWKRTSAPSTFGLAERKASAEWAQPQQRCHLWSPPHMMTMYKGRRRNQRCEYQTSAEDRDVFCPLSFVGLMLSTLCCFRRLLFNSSFVLGFLGLNVGTYSSCLCVFLVWHQPLLRWRG